MSFFLFHVSWRLTVYAVTDGHADALARRAHHIHRKGFTFVRGTFPGRRDAGAGRVLETFDVIGLHWSYPC